MKSIKTVLVTLVVLLVLGYGMSYAVTSNLTSSLQQDDPTTAENRPLTPTQIEHSKLYKKYGSGRKIPDLLRSEKGNVELYRLQPMPTSLANTPTPTSQEIIQRLTCFADVVIVGTVTKKSSHPTEDQSFIFTDYVINVREVLKRTSPAFIPTNSEITVTRPGGTILINKRKVNALDESFQLLKVGEQYLLFLRFIPETGTYKSIDSGDTFSLKGDKLKLLKKSSTHRIELDYTALSLLNEVRVAGSTSCGDDGVK